MGQSDLHFMTRVDKKSFVINLCQSHQGTFKLELLQWWGFNNILNAFDLFALIRILQVMIFLLAS